LPNARIPKDFSAAEGVWVYSFYKKEFVKVSSGGGKVVIKFFTIYHYLYTARLDTTNDAEYTISKYVRLL
jgi:hypothetical protein